MVEVYTKNGLIKCYKEEADNLIKLGLASEKPIEPLKETKVIKNKEIK